MAENIAIHYRNVDELIPYANNSRTHSDEQVTQIAASIKEFGWTNPVLVDGDNGIIAGHGRLMAAKKLGIEEVPCIELGHLSEAQRRAYIIADNKLALNAGWDEELLAIELEELRNMGYDVALTGFSDDEIDALVPMEVIGGNTDPDNVPEVPEIPSVEYGETYLLGEHRLMCGDSTKEQDVAALVAPFADFKRHCISDPPYGIAYDPKTAKYGMIKNDDTFLDYIGLAKKYTDGFFFMWTSYQVVDEWIGRIKNDFEKITNMIIWHKGGGGLGDCLKTLSTDYEIGLVVNRGNEIQSGRIGSAWYFDGNKRREWLHEAKKDQLVHLLERLLDGDVVWRVGKDNTADYLHPTQKPVEVNQKALHHFTKRGDVVVDLFLGSGSNLIACHTMNRTMAGMELDPHYCDVIIRRWQDFTGEKAIRESDGRTYNAIAFERSGK